MFDFPQFMHEVMSENITSILQLIHWMCACAGSCVRSPRGIYLDLSDGLW